LLLFIIILDEVIKLLVIFIITTGPGGTAIARSFRGLVSSRFGRPTRFLR
jgi:hypothetical protein